MKEGRTQVSAAAELAISVRGLSKSFGDVHALDGVDLEVAPGTVMGLLGPNGAGKTTAVRVMATLLQPDAGEVFVAGLDVVKDAAKVRERIGLAGQYAAIDENLTGLENLVMVGRLYGMKRAPATVRGRELLDRFGLTEAAGRPAKTYSGGMRRRLDLGAALVAKPPVLFLDEPTTGLDPRSRLDLWTTIEELVAEGRTVLLDDAVPRRGRPPRRHDRCDRPRPRHRHGDARRAEGPRRRRAPRGAPGRARRRQAAVRALAPLSDEPPHAEGDTVTVGVRRRAGMIVEAVRRLDEAGVGVDDIALRRPTLDDVFLSLTGHVAEVETDEAATEEATV